MTTPLRLLRRTWVAAALLTAAVASTAQTVAPAAVKLLTAGAMKSVVLAATAGDGPRVAIDNDTAGALQKRVMAGEAFDLIVLPMAGLDALAKAGRVDAASVRPLARAGVGVAVRSGAPLPDLSTVEAFRQAMLNARRIAYIDPAAGGSSGIYLQSLFTRLGLADAVAPKAVLVPGGLTAARVASGEADVAVQQVSELLAVDGVTLAGMLPAEIQQFTVYGAALSTTAAQNETARRVFALLGGEAAQQAMKRYALMPALEPAR